MNIYLLGHIGISEALKLFKEKRAVFEARFSGSFLRHIESLGCEKTFTDPEVRELINKKLSLANGEDNYYICSVKEGGLFGTLWDACEALKCGCEIQFSDIPVKQEVVEIAEITGENPYELNSEGSFLIFLKEQQDFSNVENGILSLIGKTTRKKGRIVRIGDTERYLTPENRRLKDKNNRTRCERGE